MNWEAVAVDAGKNVFAAGILLPVVWYFLKQNTNNQKEYVSAIKQGFERLDNQFNQIEIVIGAIGQDNVKDISLILQIGSTFLELAFYEKIDFVRQRLEKNNLHERSEKIKSHIRIEWESINNSKCFKPLDKIKTPVGPLGTWIEENFAMEECMEEVFDVVFSDDKLHKKLTDIGVVVKSYEIELWKDLNLSLKETKQWKN